MTRTFNFIRTGRVLFSTLALMLISMHAANAEDVSAFPSHVIRVISPFAAASVSDLALRQLSVEAGKRLKAAIVVENMPTGGGIQAARTVKTAAPDGYTLALLSNASAVTMATFKSPGFDPVKDYVPVTGMSEFAYLLLTNYSSQYKTLNDLLTAARASPRKLNIGTSAPGTTPYLTALLLQKAAGVEFTLVPFKGAAELTVALIRNDIDVAINAYGAVKGQLESKSLRAVAATTTERSTFLPDVPTAKEAGVSNFEAASWNGIYAPAGTPPEILAKLANAFDGALADPVIKKSFTELGVELWAVKPDVVNTRMKNEIVRWNKIVQEFNLPRE